RCGNLVEPFWLQEGAWSHDPARAGGGAGEADELHGGAGRGGCAVGHGEREGVPLRGRRLLRRLAGNPVHSGTGAGDLLRRGGGGAGAAAEGKALGAAG